VPADVLPKVKRINARDEFGDMHAVFQSPPGWVISSVEIDVFPISQPESRKRFSAQTWTRPNEPDGALHIYVQNVKREFDHPGPPNTFTWRIVSAKGHRINAAKP
jgi:hypothetical protein